MTSNSKVMRMVLLFTILYARKIVFGKKSFIASFQSKRYGVDSASIDEWIDFSNKMPSTKEFTACNWIKPKYFNKEIAVNLWSYCTIETVGATMECLQMFLQARDETAQKELMVIGEIKRKNKYTKFVRNVQTFYHRSWAHFCWSLSSITGQSKFFYNGNLLGVDTINDMENQTIISSVGNVFDAAFIFGQEPDSMRGGYAAYQAFFGDLTELNVWSYILDDVKITKMAQCKDWIRGNAVSWEKANLKAHNVIVKDMEDASSLCSKRHRLVIFPQKVTWSEAKEVCAIHGGKLALPTSEKEDIRIIQIMLKHKNKCHERGKPQSGQAVWIGATAVNQEWYQVNSNGSSGNFINYTNWPTDQANPNDGQCAYLQNDGLWQYGDIPTCIWKTLCTVCFIPNMPVFTLKGLCGLSDVDYNYYLALDNMNQVKLLEGYRDTNLIKSKSGLNWEFSAKVGSHEKFSGKLLSNDSSRNYPIGRRNWLIDDRNCKIEQQMKTIVISRCDVDTEFTCDSGTCIDLNKRCDEKNDCIDGSDENLCFLVSVPVSYKKDNPPKPKIPRASLKIHTQVTIINIDSIDTVNMIVGLTIKIRMKWYDERLTFRNPSMNQDNILSAETGRQLWLPLDNLIHENAIIGEVKYDNQKEIMLHPGMPEGVNFALPIENRIFNGSNSLLEVSQRMKIRYNCIFNVKNFPFDRTECYFPMGINLHKSTALHVVEDGTIMYNGPSIVGQFLIASILSNINNTNRQAQFIFVIPMSRMFTNQLLITFIPTFLLWLFGYATLFIDIEHSSDRFMGAGTALLVIATLLNVINGDLPKTSYLKFIDVWFVWHILIVFAIIVYHIVLDRMRKHFEKVDDEYIQQFQATDDTNAIDNVGSNKINRINLVGIMVLPLLNGIFYGIYFYLTIISTDYDYYDY